ncbi:response regulator [Pontibacillus yanchengensis]|uniref:Response regulator n=2 Tax=Pontibacillus yanchengensis TaxID=462910 RepID=A0ACC7VI27_9BACI|nr:response regulator [Pontibacillus yanchengensis]MYL35692.1 response regulator [Pontibacillus yanchengensis]MYL54591.1 response regulator [Pontibacillus yanchengensis]
MTKTVLVVDDQPGIRMLLEEVIKTEGYHILLAQTGQEAIDQVTQHQPDLMLVDLKLPIKDGLTVVRELEEENRIVPTIIMSGLAEDELVGKKFSSNIKGVIAKPFNIQDVRELIIGQLE